jgi:hypothetical protein
MNLFLHKSPRIAFVSTAILLSLSSKAQIKSEWSKQKQNVKIQYAKHKGQLLENEASAPKAGAELSLGINIYTNGLGGNINWRAKYGGRWQLSIAGINHEKEVKQRKNGAAYRELGVLRPYVFGKVNFLYAVQAGYGKELLLLPSLINNNTSLGFSFVAGLEVRIEKPVYLQLIYHDSTNNPYILSSSFSEDNAESYLTNARILGADKWSKGIGESTISPGIFCEPSITFTIGEKSKFVQRIYIGSNISYNLSASQIMAQHNGVWV